MAYGGVAASERNRRSPFSSPIPVRLKRLPERGHQYAIQPPSTIRLIPLT